MTLHDLIQKLYARGCPVHPRLKWPGMDEPHWWSTSHGLLCGTVDESDARDLLAMHVFRWFVGENFGRSEYNEAWGGKHGGIQYTIDLDDRRKSKPYKRWCVCGLWPWPAAKHGCEFKYGVGDDILEAIEAATRHLEPKEPK